MNMNTKGLGRGLSSLIPPKKNSFNTEAQIQASDPALQASSDTQIVSLPMSSIKVNPLQPRKDFDQKTLEELAASIQEYGLLEPILVTPHGAGQWQIIAGERRLRAFQLLQKETIPAIVRSASELERLELALIENIQREDLNPIEKAQSFSALINQFGLTHWQAAEKLGIGRPTLTNTMRLLELPTEIQVAIAEGKLSEGHAKALVGLRSEEKQLQTFHQAMETPTGVTVREMEEMVRSGKPPKRHPEHVVDTELRSSEDEMQKALGTKVHVKKSVKGKTQIIVETYSPEEFRRVSKLIISCGK